MIYPFSFIDRTCVHCGAPKGLVFLDKYNKENNNTIYDINKMICKLCRTEFRIHWIDIDGNIFTCNSLKDKKLGNINECSYRLIHFKKTICCADSCSCEYNLPKVRIFE